VPNASRLLDLWDRGEYQYKKCMGCLKKSPRTPDKLLCDDCLEEVKIIAERFLGDRARTTFSDLDTPVHYSTIATMRSETRRKPKSWVREKIAGS